MSRDFKVSLLTVFIIAVVAVFLVPHLANRDYPAIAQRVNLEVAERKVPEFQSLLDADPAFKNVRAAITTGGYGGIAFHGFVDTESELLRLLKVVAEKGSPVAIVWQVRVSKSE